MSYRTKQVFDQSSLGSKEDVTHFFKYLGNNIFKNKSTFCGFSQGNECSIIYTVGEPLLCSCTLYTHFCDSTKSPPHCKDKIPKFRNKYSQKRNIGVSVPISIFMRLWAIYIFPRSVCLFCWRKYIDRSWDYINRSQTHECWNWGWGRAIPRKGILKRDFRCSPGCQAAIETLDLNRDGCTNNI